MEIFPIISFFTGVISVLSPCILPILPIFVGVSLKSKSKMELVSFICGILTIFVVIIVLTAFFTSILYSYIPYVRLFSAILLLIVGILMLFDYQFSFKSLPRIKNDGLISSYLFGFFTSLAWASCYTGYLISLIALLASSTDTAYAIFNIVIYCIGFAFTLFVLSFIISKINLEKLISKAAYLPKIFAVCVICGAVYLLANALGVLV